MYKVYNKITLRSEVNSLWFCSPRQLKAADVKFYPLRPELIESTYLLFRATKHPFYLHVGRTILDSLNNHTRVRSVKMWYFVDQNKLSQNHIKSIPVNN